MLTVLAAALLAGACSRQIGDECRTSIDCSPTTADRTCDISQPGGYCTIDGCDERSCPDESVCIRIFPRQFLTDACTVDADCLPDAFCLEDGAARKCAPRSSERRYCALSCGSNGDCRGGYECRETGAGGTLSLTRTPGQKVRFCAPRP